MSDFDENTLEAAKNIAVVEFKEFLQKSATLLKMNGFTSIEANDILMSNINHMALWFNFKIISPEAAVAVIIESKALG